MRIKQGLQTILNEVTANGAGVALKVSDYKTLCFEVATKGNANAKISFAISSSKEQPDFNSPPSYTNRYSYVQIIDLSTNAPLSGSTGIVLSGTDIIKNFEVNTNYIIEWFCPIVSNYSAGTIDVKMDAVNDYTR